MEKFIVTVVLAIFYMAAISFLVLAIHYIGECYDQWEILTPSIPPYFKPKIFPWIFWTSIFMGWVAKNHIYKDSHPYYD